MVNRIQVTHRVRRWLAIAVGIGVGATVLSACGGGGGTGAITLYNGQHVQTTDALVQAFEHQSGIRVLVHSDDESVLADQILTEGRRSPADVIFTENTPALELLQSKGLLARLPNRVFATSPATAGWSPWRRERPTSSRSSPRCSRPRAGRPPCAGSRA